MLLTARQAADRLGIKLDTLYAYVSRGRLRSVRVPGTRERRYRAADVEALRNRNDNPPPDPAAAAPVVSSSLSLIAAGRFYYRGEDAVRLAETATLEDVAALLWQVEKPSPPTVGGEGRVRGEPPQPADDITPSPQPSPPRGRGGEGLGEEERLGLIERCQIRLARLAAADLLALDLTRAGVARTGARILAALAAALGGEEASAAPIHRRLAAAWRLSEAGADILRRVLVLIADHELNASTFVARCVASTGATPYAVVGAALAALSGRRHGGLSARAEAMLREVLRSGEPLAAMAERLTRGEDLPGFGHFLYPEGDPRARAILNALGAALAPVLPEGGRPILAAAEAGARLAGAPPNVDFALAAAAAGLGLPREAALGLFVVGRTVGWIAHAIEQYESQILIRPRARYIGPPPAGS
ncbi:MAG TPA: citrate synthase family protein [Stellaceae bacterium]|nr:citrate synthase family protein [Stellaceae bacterium]